MTHFTGNVKDIFVSYLQEFERLRGKAIEYRSLARYKAVAYCQG